MNFKYSAKFQTEAKIHKGSFKQFEAQASVEELKELRSLLPEDSYMKEHDDLLFCSFNLAVAGLINLNNHGIMPETAAKMAKYWANRPLNIEHNRYNNVGFISNTGFSTFPDNKIISIDDALASKQPFNLSMGAVIWKVVDPWLADYLEHTNKEESCCYANMSTSWEVGFSEICIARGSKNLFDAEIITDEKEVERLSKYLVQMGGNGFDDKNKEVYMVISGDARPLGGGITSNPAAAVKGIYIPNMEEEEKDEEPETQEDSTISASQENKTDKVKEIISQKNKFTVKRYCMKYKDVNEFCDKYAEAIASQEVFAASQLREFISDELMKEAEKWKSEVTLKEDEAKAANKKVEELQAAVDIAKDDVQKNQKELEDLRAELSDIKQKSLEAAASALFNSRMLDLDNKYDLSEKVRSVIAKSIKDKTDEEYASWLDNEGEVILAGKEKKLQTQEEGLKDAKASTGLPPNTLSLDQQVEDKPLKPKATVKGRNIELSFE